MIRLTNKVERYLALDGLRGVAAIAVVLYHISAYFRLGFTLNHAYLAVDFFFLLSGFVIAHAYDQRFKYGLGVISFAVVRLIRLYPLVLLGIAIGTTVLLGSMCFGYDVTFGPVVTAALMNALLLPSPAMLMLRPWAFPVDNPLWSLAWEYWINIIFAAAFPVLTKFRLGLVILAGALMVCWVAVDKGTLNAGFTWQDFYLGGFRVLFPFSMGVLLCRSLRGRGGKSRWGHMAFVPLIAVFAAPAVWGGAFDAFAVLLAFPLVLLAAAHAPALPRLDRVWRFLGEISYPLYVTHYPLIVVLSTLAHQHGLTGWHLYGAAIICFAANLIIAMLAMKFYDKPVRAFLKSLVRTPVVLS